MTNQACKALVPVASSEAPASDQSCCRIGVRSARSKWLMVAAAALAITGLITGSALFGFAAIAPILYLAPCLIMCGMCLFGMKKGQAASS